MVVSILVPTVVTLIVVINFHPLFRIFTYQVTIFKRLVCIYVDIQSKNIVTLISDDVTMYDQTIGEDKTFSIHNLKQIVYQIGVSFDYLLTKI